MIYSTEQQCLKLPRLMTKEKYDIPFKLNVTDTNHTNY